MCLCDCWVGITPRALWTRLEAAKPAFPLTLDASAKSYLWSTLIACHPQLEFYSLPEPRGQLIVYNRFEQRDPDSGIVLQAVSACSVSLLLYVGRIFI